MNENVKNAVLKEIDTVATQIVLQTASLNALSELQIPGAMAENIGNKRKEIELQLALNKIYIKKLEDSLKEEKPSKK